MTQSDAPARFQRLIDSARMGNTGAFCALVAEEEPRLLNQARQLCQDPALAEDLAQETLVEAWKSLHRFNGQCRFSTWLHSILLHRYQKALRHARVRPFFCLSAAARDEALRTLRALEGSPDDLLSQAENHAHIRRCIAALPEAQRNVIMLRFFADAPLDEIAAALHCSVETVKSRLFHALKKLRKMNLRAPGGN